MGMRAHLEQAWMAFWTLRRERNEPAWARILIASALSFAISLALALLAGVLRFPWIDAVWLKTVALPLVFTGVVIGNTLLALFRALEWWGDAAALGHLQTQAGWRAISLLSALAAAGIVLGYAIGLGLLRLMIDRASWEALTHPNRLIHFALLTLVLVGANLVLWTVRARQLARRRQAVEAQLHLLQAQIEPQFLFNTLADVQGLLDHDPDGARQMLEEFTDYLRASLGQLRRADTTLAAELDMAQCYLQLLRLRMGERLRFSIEASVQARAAVLPPLILQPLVENAIRHGLTPKASGGSVHIHAAVSHGQLQITVNDDGIGLSATHFQHGLALGNIRARLQARYGDRAKLSLTVQEGGTRAAIGLPFVGAAVDSSHAV